MKAKIRIATREYCYVEVEVDESAARLFEIEKQLQELHRPSGITEDEMNMVVDKMQRRETVNGGIEIYERMNSAQKYACNTIKRWFKRQNYQVKKHKNADLKIIKEISDTDEEMG